MLMPPQTRRDTPNHVLLVGSSGGHLAQLYALEPWWAGRRRTWVTFRTPDAESVLESEHVHWAHFPTTRSTRNLVRNLALAVRLIARERPDVVVSTGAGVALPFFVVAWAARIPTAYIEVYDRIDTPTLTARLCRPFTTLLCAQWDEQVRFYPDARVIGCLL
jgi:UDP-N-acetylglucosamine:LPS N-acetylglucosamine transferase